MSTSQTPNIDASWAAVLHEEFSKPYFKQLTAFVNQAYNTSICYPKGSLIFAAFDRCKFDDVKVVIIGQDPYHGPGQANGLCFSVNDGMPFPPSLRNIFIELQHDLDLPLPISGNLERWADQGVLLLNATLSVEHGKAGSHQNQGWEEFTDAVIELISREKQEVVFLLWGSFAKKKGAKIDAEKHHVLVSGHPSPMSANRGHWFGNKHFSQTNHILRSLGKEEILW
jgi:uracil-DNA glycosylase